MAANSLLRASTLYKKQDGSISLSKDRQTVLWTPASPPGAPPSLRISVVDITNLQQSPASSPRVSIRFVIHRSGSTVPENHDFRFTSPTTAKKEQEALVEVLRNEITTRRAGTGPPAAATPETTAAADNAVQSAAMTFAQVVSGVARAAEVDQFSDVRLISDLSLQKSLLESSAELRRRFNESLKARPTDAITPAQFSREFWSSRVHLLRAHAIEKSQRQGSYNVLSEIKTKDGKLKLSKEQIQLIFNQHPLVARVYDALCPKPFSEFEFWSKFFASKLFKKLKGEKITEMDADIPEMDRFLNEDEDALRSRQFIVQHIPRFIDLEGNEQNHSQRQGNAPDFTLRPQALNKVPIMRVLNNMSEQLVGNVEPADEELFAPVGQLDEEEYRQLQDKFLQQMAEDNRIALNIKDPQKFFAREKEREGRTSKAANPTKVLRELGTDLKTNTNLLTGFDEEEEEELAMKATKSIMRGIKRRRERMESDGEAHVNLSPSVFGSASMTHSTTIEFLHYFWTVFLSGDDSRAGELQNLVETLKKSLERVDAIATDAESERQQMLRRLQEQAEEFAKRTGKRRRISTSGVYEGKDAVEDLLRATVRAVRYADGLYKKALTEQVAQAQILAVD